MPSNHQINSNKISSKRVRDSPSKSNNTTKQLTLNDYWLSKPQSINRFSILDVDEDNEDEISENIATKPLPDLKQPPIYISKFENIQPLRDLLEEIILSHYLLKVLRGDAIKIQPLNIDSYRIPRFCAIY